MDFVRELWGFLRVRKKFWLISRNLHDGCVRRLGRAEQRFGDRAVHLHAVLGRTLYVLGISAFYHDSAAALVTEGRIVAAAQEERFTRKKNDAGFPRNAIQYCLEEADIEPRRGRLRRLLRKAIPQIRASARNISCLCAPRLCSFRVALPIWLKEKLFQKRLLRKELERLRRITIGTSGCCSASITRATPPRRSFLRLSRRPRS